MKHRRRCFPGPPRSAAGRQWRVASESASDELLSSDLYASIGGGLYLYAADFGGGACLEESQLESDATSWGTTSDNSPGDVLDIEEADGASESFACDEEGCE